MSDLDVIREARDYLAGLIEGAMDGPWEAVQWRGGAGWRIDAGDDRISLDIEGGEVFHESDARLIVALRASAPWVLSELDDEADRFTGHSDGARGIHPDEDRVALAKAILATKGQE